MNLHAEMTAAAGAASGVVDGVRPEQFGDPTPDTEWDVRTLLNHIILWTSHSLERRAHGESVAPELMEHRLRGRRLRRAYRAQLDRALAAWSDPAVWDRELNVMGSRPGVDVAALMIAEMVLHGWDLAAATGQSYAVDDAAAAAALPPSRRTPTCSASTRGSPSRWRWPRAPRSWTGRWPCQAATRTGRRRRPEELSARRPPGRQRSGRSGRTRAGRRRRPRAAW